MKYTLKTLTALGLICSLLNAAQAEDALKKEDHSAHKAFAQQAMKDEQELMDYINIFTKEMAEASSLEEKSNWTDAKNDLTFVQIRPHLNDIERHHISLLLDKAVNRMFDSEIQKYQASLPASEKDKKLPKTQYILGHLWISSVKYLNPEEYKIMGSFLEKGMQNKYCHHKDHNADHSLLPMPEPTKTLSKEEQEANSRHFKWMLGSTWLSVFPYLSDADYKKLTEVIFLGFDRFVKAESVNNKKVGKS